MAQANAEDRVSQPVKQTPKDVDFFGVWSRETATEKGYKILLYGASGSGKTYMAGTFPDPIFLDLEDGMRTLLPFKRKILRYPKDPSQSITELSQVKKFYQMVKTLPPSQAPFKAIVIDSLNELQVLLMGYILKIEANRLWEDQPTMQDYGKLARDMQGMVRGFLQLPYHVVMTAAATDREFDEDKILPMFVGKKTGPDLRRIIEQIGFCHTIQKKDQPIEHRVGFNDCPAYLAKDRTGKLTRPIPNNFQALLEASNKEK